MIAISVPPTQEQADEAPPLLLEVGVEEVPSNLIMPTLKQLSEAAKERFSSASIVFSPPEVYGTPRRLMLHLSHLAPDQNTTTEVIIGPPKRISFDADGRPTAAATGFARSQGIPFFNVQVRFAETLGAVAKGKKGEYLVIEKIRSGEKTAVRLPKILPEILSALSFPRSMRWNQSGYVFVRPIRWIVALYGGQVIPFSYAGVTSGDHSYGHRLMAPDSFPVHDFTAYKKALIARKVLIDPAERVHLIKAGMEAIAKEKQGSMGSLDEALLWEAANTVEYPKVICGGFDLGFLEIPKEIIITAMEEHQGYFPLYARGDERNLLPNFIAVLNVETGEMATIIKGNERVLRARLLDARFYYRQDRKIALADRLEDLKQVTFQEKLGTFYEKVVRLVSLSESISKALVGAEAVLNEVALAARLCKCDLLTGIVREFPSLQGIMGRIYAEKEGKDCWVAEAIEAHYLPKFSGGPLPESRTGQVLAIADKIDTIVGCFGVGLIPSGSEDPYALRRQGLGVIQIILSEAAFRTFSLEEAIKQAIKLYEAQNKFSAPGLEEKIKVFLKRRLDAHLQSKGIRYDLRDAVLAGGLGRPWDIAECADALVEFSKAAHFGSLITVFKRAIRILPPQFEGAIDAAILSDPAEKHLYQAYEKVQDAFGPLWASRSYGVILEKLLTLYEPLNQFFDDVLVMDKNEALRHNRLSLLFAVSRLFSQFGDFSKIVEGETVS